MWTSTIFGADVHDPKGSRKILYKTKSLVAVSDIFYFILFCSRARERRRGGAGFFIKKIEGRGGGFPRRRRGREKGAGGMSVGRGGGLNIFLGAEMPTKNGVEVLAPIEVFKRD